MARNGSRRTLPHFIEENGLKRFVLILRRLQDVFFERKCRIANSTLQKRRFWHVFAHFLAWCFCEFDVVKIQTSRAAIAISACDVGKLRLRRCQTRRFKTYFAPLHDVCKSSKKKAKRRFALSFCLFRKVVEAAKNLHNPSVNTFFFRTFAK